jgi:hypothetical protein
MRMNIGYRRSRFVKRSSLSSLPSRAAHHLRFEKDGLFNAAKQQI